MANLKISELSTASTPTGVELVEIVQGGVNKKTTVQDIANLVTEYFLGLYTTLSALQAAHPTASSGNWAIVDPGIGTYAVKYLWDEDEGWVAGGSGGASSFSELTGSPSDNAALLAALDLKANALMTIYEKTASYTLLAADLTDVNDGKVLLFEMNVASANTFTIPPNATVAFPVGTVIYVDQTGAGQVTMTPDTGVTFQGGRYKTSEQYAGCYAKKVATNTWRIQGSLTS